MEKTWDGVFERAGNEWRERERKKCSHLHRKEGKPEIGTHEVLNLLSPAEARTKTLTILKGPR